MAAPFLRAQLALVTVICAASASPSAAQPASLTVVGEIPAAIPVSEPHRGRLTAGTLPSLGIYWKVVSGLGLGVRVRAGAVAASAAPVPEGMSPPASAGLLAAALAVRYQRGAVWGEAALGGGLTGSDRVPVVEAGVGLSFGGRLQVGPSLRVLRVLGGASTMVDPGTADVALLGLEVSLRPRAARRPGLALVARAATPSPPGVPALALEVPDVTRPAVDVASALPTAIEVAEAIGGCVGDAAACDDAPIAAIGDRLIMSTTVLFDTDRARVRHHARPALERLAESLRAHPDTLRIRIEGHADVRGEAAYNLWLSQLRAERVAAALVGYGVRADQIDTVGYGNTRPRAAATDEAGHARNRRVEFVLIDARAATAPEAP